MPTIAINMVVYNEEERLKAWSKSKVLDYFDEFVIVDQSSTDATLSVLKDFKQFIKTKVIIDTHHGYCEPSRRMALDNTESDWVLYLDADETPSDEFLKNLRNLTRDVYDGYCVKFEHRVDDMPEAVAHFQHKYRLFKRECVNYLSIIHSSPTPKTDNHIHLEYVCINHFKTRAEWWVDHNRYTKINEETND